MRPKSQALFCSFSYSSLSFSSLLSILPPLFPVYHPPSLPPSPHSYASLFLFFVLTLPLFVPVSQKQLGKYNITSTNNTGISSVVPGLSSIQSSLSSIHPSSSSLSYLRHLWCNDVTGTRSASGNCYCWRTLVFCLLQVQHVPMREEVRIGFLLQPATRGQSSSLVPRCCSRPADRRMCLHAAAGFDASLHHKNTIRFLTSACVTFRLLFIWIQFIL